MPRFEPIPYDELDPELRARYDAGVAEGRYSMTLPLQIYAYAKTEALANDESYRLTFRQGLLGPRLEELLRIRSAQLNGCAPCASSRKDPTIGDDDVACMVDGASGDHYDDRERLALRFLELMCNDHFAIDDETFRELATVFSVAEIIELGLLCGRFIGGHRFTHLLDIFTEREPQFRYDPAAVNTGRALEGAQAEGA